MRPTFAPTQDDETIAQERETITIMTRRERGSTTAEYMERRAREAAFYAKFGHSKLGGDAA